MRASQGSVHNDGRRPLALALHDESQHTHTMGLALHGKSQEEAHAHAQHARTHPSGGGRSGCAAFRTSAVLLIALETVLVALCATTTASLSSARRSTTTSGGDGSDGTLQLHGASTLSALLATAAIRLATMLATAVTQVYAARAVLLRRVATVPYTWLGLLRLTSRVLEPIELGVAIAVGVDGQYLLGGPGRCAFFPESSPP